MDNNTKNTFWGLISDCTIEIPQLQRDYAQGRKEDTIKQIREALVTEFFEVLVQDDKELILNFIYGERKEECFTPIDGQQRLTSLFLLHWYIFMRTNYTEGLEKLRKFQYLTRDSSKRFCGRICGVELDFSQQSISKQIEDCFWFSGNFSVDPTVSSMLVMIDTIHEKFMGVDCEKIKERLIGNDCPISFLWLPMDNFQKTDDLYIKMNARGKLLTDFEIFKAKLQGSRLIKGVLGADVSEQEKIYFISKFNNQYAELFYRFFEEKYDDAMMAFIISMMRDDYFAYACERDVAQKYYREDYKKPIKMNGSIFFRFVECGGMTDAAYENCDKSVDVFASAIRKIDNLFSLFCKHQNCLSVENTLDKNYYDETELFKINYYDSKAADTLAKYALFGYIDHFGFPDNEDKIAAYSMWKRFVYNIITNTDVASHIENICESMIVFNKMIKNITQETEQGVLEQIRDIAEAYGIPAGIRSQYDEEQTKAILMLQGDEWREAVLLAENYFVDGQIGFLLQFSEDVQSGYSIKKFMEGFNTAKRILNEKKNLKDCDATLFEQALLCMDDYTAAKTGHLARQSNSTTTWGFYRNDYSALLSNRNSKDKKQIWHELLRTLNGEENINEKLVEIIKTVDLEKFDEKSKWKCAFIQNNLFGANLQKYSFSNCIHLAKENSEILLLIGTTVRSYSMELYTYLLYLRLLEVGIKKEDMYLHIETTGDIERDGFPIRYIGYKSKKIAYMNGKDDGKDFGIKNPDDSIEYLSKEDAIKMIKEL